MSSFVAQVKAIADIIVYVWLFFLAIAFGLSRFNRLGFVRTLPGLWSPPVSESINRTGRFDNAESLLLLGGLLLLRGTRDLVVVTLGALLIDCLNGVLFPKTLKSRNISSILFSYLGFLLLRGYFESGAIAILTTILVGCVSSRMLWGMIPVMGDSTWKAHLLSFGGGAVMAHFLNAIAALLPVSRLW